MAPVAVAIAVVVTAAAAIAVVTVTEESVPGGMAAISVAATAAPDGTADADAVCRRLFRSALQHLCHGPVHTIMRRGDIRTVHHARLAIAICLVRAVCRTGRIRYIGRLGSTGRIGCMDDINGMGAIRCMDGVCGTGQGTCTSPLHIRLCLLIQPGGLADHRIGQLSRGLFCSTIRIRPDPSRHTRSPLQWPQHARTAMQCPRLPASSLPASGPLIPEQPGIRLWPCLAQRVALHPQAVAGHLDFILLRERTIFDDPLAIDACADQRALVHQLDAPADALQLGMHPGDAPARQLHSGLAATADLARELADPHGPAFPTLFLDHDFKHVRITLCRWCCSPAHFSASESRRRGTFVTAGRMA